MRPDTGIWLLLLALTATTFGVGEAGLGGVWVIGLVMGLAVLKGYLVSGFFMGLRRTRLLWRLLMLGWLVGVVGTVAALCLTAVK
ncbi:MAG TPA: hypothetical protein DEP05_08045 [Betaproteobacteria bacterium]|nr:hypothetical protein [Betaproteobacteria bacterium]